MRERGKKRKKKKDRKAQGVPRKNKEKENEGHADRKESHYIALILNDPNKVQVHMNEG